MESEVSLHCPYFYHATGIWIITCMTWKKWKFHRLLGWEFYSSVWLQVKNLSLCIIQALRLSRVDVIVQNNNNKKIKKIGCQHGCNGNQWGNLGQHRVSSNTPVSERNNKQLQIEPAWKGVHVVYHKEGAETKANYSTYGWIMSAYPWWPDISEDSGKCPHAHEWVQTPTRAHTHTLSRRWHTDKYLLFCSIYKFLPLSSERSCLMLLPSSIMSPPPPCPSPLVL